MQCVEDADQIEAFQRKLIGAGFVELKIGEPLCLSSGTCLNNRGAVEIEPLHLAIANVVSHQNG